MAKVLQGKVTSDKPDKSIVVTIVTHKTHPIYKKRYIDSQKVMAHDEKNEAKEGDVVVISETRPLSASKRYKLDKIVERPTISESDVKEDAKKAEEDVV
ncbi:30S ribosomal protein S17 [Candidatus Saccharibacteria bacterium]|nr:30S ribosomal protein S17 [Candidatus Saccharibacteria bacterium]